MTQKQPEPIPAPLKRAANQAPTAPEPASASARDEENPWLTEQSEGKKRGPKGRKQNQSLLLAGPVGSASSSSLAAKQTAGSKRKAGAIDASSAAAPIAAPAPAAKSSSAPPERKPLLMQKSQEDLVQLAFAGPDYERDFQTLKKEAVDAELGIDEKKLKIIKDVKAGWGDWAGPGASLVSDKILKRRDKLVKAAESEADEKRQKRKDVKQPNVIISDRRVKTASKFKIADVPHPFTTREEYERSLAMPIGNEFNASHVVKAYTKPEILLRAGRVIEPAKLPAGGAKRNQPVPTTISGGKRKGL